MTPTRKATFYLTLVVLFFLVLVVGLVFFLKQEFRLIDTKEIRVGKIEMRVYVADSEIEKIKGLSGWDRLDEDRGMLFVFDKPDLYQFWMKDMKFPIDIIWIGEDKRIGDIRENISPETYPVKFISSQSVLYVLEVNAGWTAKNNIKIGDKIEF